MAQTRNRPTGPPPLLADYETYDKQLGWLERWRTMMEGVGAFTVEMQSTFGALASQVLLAAAGEGPPVALDTAVAPVVRPERNGRPARRARLPDDCVTLNERMMALGYGPQLGHGQRIKLGHLVVLAYKAAHGGKGPRMTARVEGSRTRRVAYYGPEDFPVVDRVLRDELGAPPAEVVG